MWSVRPRVSLQLGLLGFVHAAVWIGARLQIVPLLGADGLLPACRNVDAAPPTLFSLACSDAVLNHAAELGVLLSFGLMLGLRHLAWPLWLLQLSVMHIGQTFWSFGWELLLAEVTFLAAFSPSPVLAWAWRWLSFRLMFGAGLIKLRGDPCWAELTCLDTHFLTQPLPNPLSPWFHHLPHEVLAGGVLVNHLVELLLPWLLFTRWRRFAVYGWAGFQLVLILSGNLAFLNWLSIAAASFVLIEPPGRVPRSHFAVGLLLATLSVLPTLNLLSPRQAMNASFDPLHLVNTYGAFGSVDTTREELILEGTTDGVTWRPYTFPCKPGEVTRRPCVAAPLHWRLDWQMWFAWRGPVEDAPWLVHLVAKALEGRPGALVDDPFAGTRPTAVRIRRFHYRFGEDAWWEREEVEPPFLAPITREDPGLRRYLAAYGWE